MARYARIEEVGTSATVIESPTAIDSFVRIENLGDPDTGDDVWIALVDTDEDGAPLTVTVEGPEECVRIRPGTSQLFRYRRAFQMIASSATDVLLQTSNGLE